MKEQACNKVGYDRSAARRMVKTLKWGGHEYWCERCFIWHIQRYKNNKKKEGKNGKEKSA